MPLPWCSSDLRSGRAASFFNVSNHARLFSNDADSQYRRYFPSAFFEVNGPINDTISATVFVT
jgi:hypothetical protein